MKKFLAILLSVMSATALFSGCGAAPTAPSYKQISPEEAKQIMETKKDYCLLDVRTAEEFASGHIPGAILIPDYEIAQKAEDTLTDKNQLILVYCRSGRRSKLAAETLANLGYTNVFEFGGIIDWVGEIVTE